MKKSKNDILPKSVWAWDFFPLLMPCLHWNDLPLEWNLETLNVQRKLCKNKKIRTRIRLAIRMYEVLEDKVSAEIIHSHILNRNMPGITPLEFLIFAIGIWPPAEKAMESLQDAPPQIFLMAHSLFCKKRRRSPNVITGLAKSKNAKTRKELKKITRNRNRDLCRDTTIKVYNKLLMRKALPPTESDILHDTDYEDMRHRLRDENGNNITKTDYSDRLHLRWIKKTLEELTGKPLKRPRGRPSKFRLTPKIL